MAILLLALGIGANTAIFSFMDSILLRSLPVPDPQSLVMLSWRTPRPEMHGSNRHDESYTDPNGGYIVGIFAYPAFELIRKNDSVFSRVFGYQGAGKLNLTFRGYAELANTEYVSGDYFRGLGVPPAAGRLLAPDDDRASAPAVAVISFALSQRRFGGPENATGQSILIDNLPFTVVGVAPPEFFGVDPDIAPDIYVPLHANVLLQEREYSAATNSTGHAALMSQLRKLSRMVSHFFNKLRERPPSNRVTLPFSCLVYDRFRELRKNNRRVARTADADEG